MIFPSHCPHMPRINPKSNPVNHISLIPPKLQDWFMKNLTFTLTFFTHTTTTGGYFVIHISSQTTKKEVYENPHLRTITLRKLLSLCDTITFAPVQSQVLHNSRTWYNRKTFTIITASINRLRLTIHRKLFATNPSPQQLSESTQKSIGFRNKVYRKPLMTFLRIPTRLR